MFQAITPNPDIPCRPGWCLAYVNEAFGVPKVYGTATAAWEHSPTKHRDMNFPPGVWVPLWFSLAAEPAGHVVLRAPDGRIYSTSHPTATRPTIHPDLADLFRTYSRYNPLTYLGWTEDVEGTRVLASITAQSAIIQEDDVTTPEQIETIVAATNRGTQAIADHVFDRLKKELPEAVWKQPIDWRDPATGELRPDSTTPETVLSYIDTHTARILDAPPADIAAELDARGIAAAVRDELVKLLDGSNG